MIQLNWPVILFTLGGIALIVFGIVYGMGWFRWPAKNTEDPSSRAEFATKLHWMTEFARNVLADQGMVDELNKVHDLFTLIRNQNASKDGK